MSSIRDILKESKDMWLHSNFTNLMFKSDASMKFAKFMKNDKKTITLNTKIYNINFHSTEKYMLLIVFIIIQGIFLFGGYSMHME